ncbi:hypothetical protein DV515_00000804, partial [Chloebia gouldiae]
GREARRAPLVHRVQMGMQANQDPLGCLESQELMDSQDLMAHVEPQDQKDRRGSQDSQVLVDFQARDFLDHLEIQGKEGHQGYQDLQALQ